MSAETLRKAAALMRERAESATPGPWVTGRSSDDMPAFVRKPGWWVIASRTDDGDAHHIASWSPSVALAVADWLDSHSAAHIVHDPRALAVARAYLGSTNARPVEGDV